MKEKIERYIESIEKEYNIKVLLACETGSRAWGIASPNSDYDVRMIYVHKNDWYLSVNEAKDSLELMYENRDLDITGWELKKTLGLLRKSNASLLERLQSPIIYSVDSEFLEEIQTEASYTYSKIATMHHYLGMAKKMRSDLNFEGEYKLKRLFYALRTAMICQWILERDEMPPIEFEKVYNGVAVSPEIRARIEALRAFKATQSEAYLHKGETDLMEYIDVCIARANEQKNHLSAGQSRTSNLNIILRKYVAKYDN